MVSYEGIPSPCVYALSSGVNLRPAAFMISIDSECETGVPHVEYRSVRWSAVPPRYLYNAWVHVSCSGRSPLENGHRASSLLLARPQGEEMKGDGAAPCGLAGVERNYLSTVVAVASEASILPQRVLNSARVMSDVQHVAEASASAESLAGENGLVHLEARSVALRVAADQLAVLGDCNIAFDDASSHSNGRHVRLLRVLRKHHACTTVADGEVVRSEERRRLLEALLQGGFERGRAHRVHEELRARTLRGECKHVVWRQVGRVLVVWQLAHQLDLTDHEVEESEHMME
eukprot:scaffold25412_cov64-Phaeocystis_antarctica.AAC.5